MPTRLCCRQPVGALALAALLAGTLALSAQPPGLDPLKRLDPPRTEKAAKTETKGAKPAAVKLPDGTYLWLGGTSDKERVTLTPQEFQKLLDRVDTLKKELAARKPTPPSGCAIRAHIEKRGEQLVAALKLTYSFRTTQANTAVSLGGRRAFLVAAALDSAKLPVLDTGDEGFAAMIEAPGDHTLTLDLEAPVTARGVKAEVGFELGLPRAPITTLALDAPGGVKRVNLVARTPDAGLLPRPPEMRRLAGVDVKQFVAKDGRAGFPLGPVDSVEVTWDPPAATAQPADQVQSAELDVTAVITEGFIESTAKVKLRGPAHEWKFVAPANAEVSVERVAGMMGETGPAIQPTVTKPAEANKPVWKVELPVGTSATDWIVTAVARQPRPKGGKSTPLPVGPFAVLDVLRQTGTVKVTAGPHTRFTFKHGPDLRRAEPPGPLDEDISIAFFRLTTGPTGSNVNNAPLLVVEVWPAEGSIRVRPTYTLKLTEAGWHIRAEVAVKPIRTDVLAVTIDVPAEWRGLESESDSEIVESVAQGKAEGGWRPVTVRLTGAMRKPFDVVLVGTVPAAMGTHEADVPLPRFPKVVERDAAVTVTVPEGQEIRGAARGWEGDQPASWSFPLTAVPGSDGKVPKAVTSVTGRSDLGLSRISLHWQPYRPDVAVEVSTDVTVGERQVVVAQRFRLRSPDGFPKPVRFRGPVGALGLRASPITPQFEPTGAGMWSFAPPLDAKEATFRVSYALPLPEHGDGPLSLPVGLIWPADAARTEMGVRVWVSSITGRTVSVSPAGWRELPPEAVPERESLPALTLVATAEHPLVLEVRAATRESAAAVRVTRALIEAGMLEDGSVGYRGRFRLQLSLTPAVEILLPETLGPNPLARVDGAQAPLVPISEGGGVRRFRVMLPGGANRATVLEVSYTLPGTRHTIGETLYRPPVLSSAVYASGVRWLISEPGDAAPLLVSVRGRAAMRWRLRGVVYAPSAASRAAMERWFVSGTEPGAADTASVTEGEPLVVLQTVPQSVRVFRVSWVAIIIACSLVSFLLLVILTWLPATASVLLVIVSVTGFVIGVVLYPQPASQAVAAAQPGFAFGFLAILLVAYVRWQVRRRVTHLPGFTRTPVEPSAVGLPSTTSAGPPALPAGASSARNRPSGSGTPPAPATAPSGT